MRWRSITYAEGVFEGEWQRQAISSTPEACGLGEAERCSGMIPNTIGA